MTDQVKKDAAEVKEAAPKKTTAKKSAIETIPQEKTTVKQAKPVTDKTLETKVTEKAPKVKAQPKTEAKKATEEVAGKAKAAPKKAKAAKETVGQKPLIINNRVVTMPTKPLYNLKPEKGFAPYELTNRKIKVTLIRSTIGSLAVHKATIEALGLKKIRSSKIHNDNAAIQGMLYRVRHLVKVEVVK